MSLLACCIIHRSITLFTCCIINRVLFYLPAALLTVPLPFLTIALFTGLSNFCLLHYWQVFFLFACRTIDRTFNIFACCIVYRTFKILPASLLTGLDNMDLFRNLNIFFILPAALLAGLCAITNEHLVCACYIIDRTFKHLCLLRYEQDFCAILLKWISFCWSHCTFCLPAALLAGLIYISSDFNDYVKT